MYFVKLKDLTEPYINYDELSKEISLKGLFVKNMLGKIENFALAFKTAIDLRRAGFKVEYDFNGRSMKSQMKQANKFQAKQVLIFGEDELSRNAVTVRNMATSEQQEIAVNDIISYFNTL